ncbi:C40 family peptidase [Candidatus Babeliales bacterium]|nr:C40 family peptidase [Candidatus Babeliales bacterium]
MSCIKIILFCTITFELYSEEIYQKKMITNVAVANLYYQPQIPDSPILLPTSDRTNPLQITQLLLCEHVIAHEQFEDKNHNIWYFVNTPQQQFFQEPVGWHGYPGWIQAKNVINSPLFLPHNMIVNKKLTDIFDKNGQKIMTISIGTRLCALHKDDQQYCFILPGKDVAYISCDDVYMIDPVVQESTSTIRSNIIQTALQFLGDWYSWGGRSAQNNDFEVSSVDCSALVHLSFLAHGLQIPRMSHEQFLKSEKISHCADLQPCDFIYFVSITKHSARMDHVMIYLGDDQILESTFADDHKVRITSFQQRMGKSCETIQSGDIIIWNDEEFYVYFGSLLPNQKFIQNLRNDALQSSY